MGVLSNPPHEITVVPMVKSQDDYGTTVIPGDPVTVYGSLQPIDAKEASERGVRADTTYRFICRSWPGGPYSEFTVVKGPQGTIGEKFDVEGDARGYSTGSRRTHRQDIIATRHGAKVK